MTGSKQLAIGTARPAAATLPVLAGLGSLGVGLVLGIEYNLNPVFIVAVVLVLPSCILAVADPLRGFAVYIVSIQVVDYAKRLLLVFDRTPSDVEWYGVVLLPDLILASAFLGTLGPRLFGRTRRQASPLLSKYRIVGSFIIAYAVWYFVRTFISSAPLLNAVGKAKLILPYFLCFYIGCHAVASRSSLILILKTLSVSVAVAAGYGLFQTTFGFTGFEEEWLFGRHTSLRPETIYAGVARAYSFYSDPHTFALTLGLTLTLLFFSRRTFGVTRWNSVPVLLLMSIALTATVVRAGWLMAMGGLFAYFIVQTSRTVIVRSALIVLALATGPLVIQEAAERAQSTFDPWLHRALTTATYKERGRGFENLFELDIIRYVAGNGVASMGAMKNLSGTQEVHFIAHDWFTESLYEVGWIGFGLFLVILVFTVRAPIPPFLGALGPALRYVVLATPAIAVAVGFVMILRPVATVFWLSVGLLCATENVKDSWKPRNRAVVPPGERRA